MKARRVKKLAPQKPLVENAARMIQVRLDEMLSFSSRALEPKRSRDQHDMRIAAKRLRYVLEATAFCFGKPAQTALRRARELQDLLGEVRDCDVMFPRIDAHVADLRTRDALNIRKRAGDAPGLDPALVGQARHRNSYRGLEVLAVYVQARRDLYFDRFVAFWEEQQRAGTWEQLERAVSRKLDETRDRRRRAERVANARRELREAENDQSTAERLAADSRMEVPSVKTLPAYRRVNSSANE